MDKRNESFFALVHLLQDGEHARSRHHAAAAGIVDYEITPLYRAALETHPQLDAEEIFELVRPALIDLITRIIEPQSKFPRKGGKLPPVRSPAE